MNRLYCTFSCPRISFDPICPAELLDSTRYHHTHKVTQVHVVSHRAIKFAYACLNLPSLNFENWQSELKASVSTSSLQLPQPQRPPRSPKLSPRTRPDVTDLPQRPPRSPRAQRRSPRSTFLANYHDEQFMFVLLLPIEKVHLVQI